MASSARVDRLVKHVADFIWQKADGSPKLIPLRKKLHEFVSLQFPSTMSAVEVAAECLVFVITDDESEDCISNVQVAIFGVMAFLADQNYRQPSNSKLMALKTILDTSPFDSDAVRHWFTCSFVHQTGAA